MPAPTRTPLLVIIAVTLCLVNPMAQAQTEASPNDSVRVSVTMNQDGSRTSYQFDPANHKALATTTESNGKPRQKVEYQLDEAGRFGSGKFYDPHGKLLFTVVYKYDAAGRLLEESRRDKDNQPAGKLVYDYDAAGKPTGYSVLDRDGNVVGRTSAATPTPRRRK